MSRSIKRLADLVDFGIGVIKQVKGNNMQAEGTADETLQATGTRLLQHFGFMSKPPAGGEMAYASGHGETASIAEGPGAGAPSDLGGGQTALYDSSGNIVGLKTTTGIVITAVDGKVAIGCATDNVEITTDAGDITAISAGGGIRLENKAGNLDIVPTAGLVRIGTGTLRKAARNTDAVNAATTMAAWLVKAQAQLVLLDPTIVAPTDFGVISGGSADTFIGD